MFQFTSLTLAGFLGILKHCTALPWLRTHFIGNTNLKYSELDGGRNFESLVVKTTFFINL